MGLVTSLLTKLTGFFSNPFLIGAFFPVVLALTVDTAILCWFHDPARVWVATYWAGDGMDKLSGFLVGILPVFVFSYIFWSVNPGLLAVLEGRGLPKFLSGRLEEWQRERFNRKQQQVDGARDQRRTLVRLANVWEGRLQKARQEGVGKAGTYQPPDLNPLRELRNHGRPIPADTLKAVCGEMERQLAAQDANGAGNDNLDRDHKDLVRLMKYAAGRAEGDYLKAFTERDQNFSYFRLAATKMGNMAESVRSYALSRYEMDIDIFWSRLLTVIRQEKEAGRDGFADFLLDQKGQLDFLVALFWLSILSNLMLTAAATLLAWSRWPLIAIVIAGPVFPVVFYELTVMKYRDFAEVQRTAIDLFRLRLLARFSLPAPRCTEDEGQLWRALTQMLRYRDDVNLPFVDESAATAAAAGFSLQALGAQIRGGK